MKTLTMNMDDSIYQIIKVAADGQRREMTNFIEFAVLQYLNSSQAETKNFKKIKQKVDSKIYAKIVNTVYPQLR